MTEVVEIVFRQRGAKEVASSIGDIERNSGGASRTVDFLKRALLTLGAGITAREVIQLSDAFLQAQARIRLVTKSTEELTAVQKALFQISQETRSSFESTTELYARIARNSKELGLNQGQLLGVTEAVNKAIQISGVSAESANAAIVQLGQGLASGTLRGDELRSVLEQVPRLAQAIADGLGVTVGDLRNLGSAGELTAEQVVNAIRNQAPTLAQEFEKIPLTFGGALTKLKNSLQLFIGRTNETTGAISSLSSVVSDFADFVGSEQTFDDIVAVFSLWADVISDVTANTGGLSDIIELLGVHTGRVFNFIKDALVQLPNNIVSFVQIAVVQITSFFTTLNTKAALLSLSAEKSVKDAFFNIYDTIRETTINVASEVDDLIATLLTAANVAKGTLATALRDKDGVQAALEENAAIQRRLEISKQVADEQLTAIAQEKQARADSFAERRAQLEATLRAQQDAADDSVQQILNENAARRMAYEEEKERRRLLREEDKQNEITPDVGGGGEADSNLAAIAAEQERQKAINDLRKKFSAERLLDVQLEAMSEQEIEQAEFDRKIAVLNSLNEAEVALIGDRNKIIEQLTLRHNARLGSIEAQAALNRMDFERKTLVQRASNVFDFLRDTTANVSQSNKTLFNIHKAAAITSAVIDGIRGVAMTLGSYPYPINIPLAAAHALAAVAQVNEIRSTSFGGGGSVSSISGGGGGVNAIGGGGATGFGLDSSTSQLIGTTQNEGTLSTTSNLGATRVINLTVERGIRDQNAIVEFIEELNDALGDNTRLESRVA